MGNSPDGILLASHENAFGGMQAVMSSQDVMTRLNNLIHHVDGAQSSGLPAIKCLAHMAGIHVRKSG